MYGGRVIDDFDRRIVWTYMEEYLGDFLFSTYQKFYFYHDINVSYRIPRGETKDEFIEAIEKLPLVNTPEVTLHFNFQFLKHFNFLSFRCLDYIQMPKLVTIHNRRKICGFF